jgi:hypothetical protein
MQTCYEINLIIVNFAVKEFLMHKRPRSEPNLYMLSSPLAGKFFKKENVE